MPDRYGESDDPEPMPAIPDPKLTAIATTIPCPYCHAERGQPCINRTVDGHPPTRIPHPDRLAKAEEVPF